MRPWLAAGAGVLAGLVAGGIWTWAQPNRYRADARVLVRPPSSRIVPAVQALAESSLVAANVQQTLHLSSPPRVSAKTGTGGVLTMSVEAGSREAIGVRRVAVGADQPPVAGGEHVGGLDQSA